MLIPGDRLGPYELLAPLGAGGMGEVWRARDPRLGREVAVKLLPAEVAGDPERLRWFEHEARATAALAHPNVVAIFDVGVHEGAPYLVEELLEGETLGRRIRAGDLTVGRSVSLAVQVAQGLAAAHDKGLVHRDLKPDNLFLTRDGVVKILDFGLAVPEAAGQDATGEATEPSPAEAAACVAGTPAYMAPEQARGRAVDHRADLFALGAVLYEMLAGARPFVGDSHADLVASILTRDPPPLPPSVPRGVQAVVLRCLEKRPEDRYTSARDVAYALEAALESTPARVMAARREEPRPYPGLAAFTEADAERFFGREEEVAALWRRIPERTLLALIGPSGAGKTSFVRAGLAAHAPPRWRCLVATPGQSPFAGLARALAPHFAGEPEAIAELIDLHRPEVGPALVARWAQGCDGALVVIDQAEELFTQSGEEVQARFAELLGRLAELDGVHVLLSLRDDYLFRCHAFPALRPVFEHLTPLGPPEGMALRKAVVEPARRLGFAFEDDALVEEMLSAVEGERGALPMLAFAVSRMWEERDRERKLLTRDAYARIGGVAGALAQHAEATLERLGEDSVPLVRELFRNLATGEQTRCVLEWEELLSVFPSDQRAEAERVLHALVDARLLTSFEVEGAEGAGHHRVEVVHESMLRSWPRLVRWQAQDEEGALLRDQLRQAARLWEERGRPEDLLWTGNAVTEYGLWRDRYPGGLSAVEEAFGDAMVEVAGRRRRRRRIAVTTVVAVLLVAAASLALMWRRSVLETRRAEAEAGKREAAELLALGRLKLADHPNAALAFAISSLERADNEPARRFALEALAQGPPALFLTDVVTAWSAAWSPDGRWLALGGGAGVAVLERGTGERRQLTTTLERVWGFSSDSRRLVTSLDGEPPTWHVWALPEGRMERALVDREARRAWTVDDGLVTVARQAGGPSLLRHLPLDGSAPAMVGRLDPGGVTAIATDLGLTRLFTIRNGRLLQQHLDDLAARGTVIGVHDGAVDVRAWPGRNRAITWDSHGEVRVWDIATPRLERTLSCPGVPGVVALDPHGRFFATGPSTQTTQTWPWLAGLFDLAAPAATEPVQLQAGMGELLGMRFSPDGSWLATSHNGTVILWRTAGPRPLVLARHGQGPASVAFTPDGDLLSTSGGRPGTLSRWVMSPGASAEPRVLWSRSGALADQVLEVDPRGRFALTTDRFAGTLVVVPLDGSQAETFTLERPAGQGLVAAWASLDPSSRFVAVGVCAMERPEARGVRVLDLETGDERLLDTLPQGSEGCVGSDSVDAGLAVPVWLRDGRLLTDGNAGLRVWDLDAGTSHLLRPCREFNQSAWVSLHLVPGSRQVLRLDHVVHFGETSRLEVVDLATGAAREITSHGNRLVAAALDSSGTVLVTADTDGLVRVGPVDGGEPHLLYGGRNGGYVAVSPDGRWIAASDYSTIRLWPMPDLSKPPLHTLPYDELLAKLKSLTNLRAVRDPASDSGWKVEIGPFPGWAEVPEWQP